MDEEYENSMVHQINSKVKGEQSTEDLEKYYNKEEKEKKQNDAKLGLSITDIIQTPNAFRDDRNENGSDGVSVASFQDNMNRNDDFDEDDEEEDEDEDFDDEDDEDEFEREYGTKKK